MAPHTRSLGKLLRLDGLVPSSERRRRARALYQAGQRAGAEVVPRHFAGWVTEADRRCAAMVVLDKREGTRLMARWQWRKSKSLFGGLVPLGASRRGFGLHRDPGLHWSWGGRQEAIYAVGIPIVALATGTEKARHQIRTVQPGSPASPAGTGMSRTLPRFPGEPAEIGPAGPLHVLALDQAW
ncbi:MAG TPA: hypothetical protein VK988_01125 [Acidimicrobiales bacterium]|nr:hypothetical protein [Acidimicrobiales bacterium]